MSKNRHLGAVLCALGMYAAGELSLPNYRYNPKPHVEDPKYGRERLRLAQEKRARKAARKAALKQL